MHITNKSNLTDLIDNPHGEAVQEILGLQAGGVQSHSLARMTIAPGKSSLPHFHKESEESYLILSGKAKLVIDAKSFELSPGDAVLIEPDEVHQIFNPAKQDLVFLAVCVPAWQPEDSFNAEAAPRA
jgi:mannose-6-phosphate isomerase-like protein (cupin superfamily)